MGPTVLGGRDAFVDVAAEIVDTDRVPARARQLGVVSSGILRYTPGRMSCRRLFSPFGGCIAPAPSEPRRQARPGLCLLPLAVWRPSSPLDLSPRSDAALAGRQALLSKWGSEYIETPAAPEAVAAAALGAEAADPDDGFAAQQGGEDDEDVSAAHPDRVCKLDTLLREWGGDHRGVSLARGRAEAKRGARLVDPWRWAT